jgi:DNA repair protein RecO (recombination protein O)
MIESATGVVLRTRPFAETSIIIQWLTPDLGRISTIAKGAHRNKSPFRGKIDLFFLADFSFNRSRRSDLHTLREISVQETHNELRHDLGYLRQAAYCANLVERGTETQTPLPEVFRLFVQLLRELPRRPFQRQTIFTFELKLLDELGLSPELSKSHLSVEAQRLARLLREADYQTSTGLKASENALTEIEHFLHGFLVFHFGRLPHNRVRALHGSEGGKQ